MGRRTLVLVLVVFLLAGLNAPVEATKKKRKKVKPVAITYYMNWFGDCGGHGYLDLKSVPNPDNCALFSPGLGDTYSFPGSVGRPFSLDATETITVDFVLISVAHVAADFEVVLEGTVNGEEKEIASGVQTVLVAGPEETPLHYDLEPDAALKNATLESLDLTVSWTSGATYSLIDLHGAPAAMVIHGFD